MVGVIGIVLSLGLLMYLAYRGISVLILAPILALLAAAFSGMPLIATYTQVFMPNLANYLKLYFPVFLLGAIFGKVMEDSGSAKAIAHAIATRLGKGINPEVLHRIVAIACGGLDSLPHNGAVVTLLGITGITHREGYADIGMVSVVIPVATCVVAIVLGSMGVV